MLSLIIIYIILKSLGIQSIPSLQPLALLSWGCRLTMSYVDPKLVTHFIRKMALRAPEWRIAEDGQFEDGLLSQSKIVSDTTDSVLCPNI